jgi:hypothetical protein
MRYIIIIFIKTILYYISMYLSKRMFTRSIRLPDVLRMSDLRHANGVLSQQTYYAGVRNGDGISERGQNILHK